MTLQAYHNNKPVETFKRVGIRISHPSITTRYLVDDMVDTVSLNDEYATIRTWQGTAIDCARPANGRMACSLGRVGTEVNKELKKITGFDRMTPVEITRFEWLSDSPSPVYVAVMYVDEIGVALGSVTISAIKINAATFRVSQRTTIAEFPALEFA